LSARGDPASLRAADSSVAGVRQGGVGMAIYDYRCGKCKKKFTVTMSIKEHDSRRVKCPKCGGRKVVQLVSAFSPITSKKS